jgi:hypothetical protein
MKWAKIIHFLVLIYLFYLLFVVSLETQTVTLTSGRRVVRWKVNNELEIESTWRRPSWPNTSCYLGMWLQRRRKVAKISWYGLSPGRVLNAVSAKYKENHVKNVVFWDVAPCRSCVNRRFGGTYWLHLQDRKIRERGTSVRMWLQTESPVENIQLYIFLPWRWSPYVPPKRRFTQDLHGVTSQKTFFIVTAVKTSNLTEPFNCGIWKTSFTNAL